MALEPFTLNELLDSTCSNGHMRFLCSGPDVRRGCLLCEATFPQTDDGWLELRAHHFEHGMASRFEWSELEGKSLRIMIVRAEDRTFSMPTPTMDVYGVDDSAGIVYNITHEFGASYKTEGGWKWKTTNHPKPSDGPSPTRFALASPSNGCAHTDAK